MSNSLLGNGHLVGTVETTQWLTPGMVRVVFGGTGLEGWEPVEHTDQYVNALFVPDGAPYSPPFDVDKARELPVEHRPRGRRLTIRRWEPVERRLTIDIVTHGDVGYAGRWAQRASRGDQLQMAGPTGGYTPDPTADWYFFAGDESALPAIAASLEMVPDGRRCAVVIVVDDRDHEQSLHSPGDLDLLWLHRKEVGSPTDLIPESLADLDWSNVDVFVHGEAAEVRAARKQLVAEHGIDRRTASISPYWRRGQDDEAWREVKRQWLVEQEADFD